MFSKSRIPEKHRPSLRISAHLTLLAAYWLCALFPLARTGLAGAPPPASAVIAPGIPVSQLRGWWVDSFHRGLRSPGEVAALVQDARRAHINTLFVQVRRRGDAMYATDLAPKAAGIPVEFDPLAALIEAAHQGSPKLEVHAWIVAMPIWDTGTRGQPPTNHLFETHTDWLTQSYTGQAEDGHSYYLDPGHPGVQEHLTRVVTDLLRRYDVDGLQLDYIRYSGNQWGYNPVALSRFKRLTGRNDRPVPEDAAWSQFRRDQVTALVRRIYLNALETKPQARISAATICFSPAGKTNVDWPKSAAFSDKFQDWRGWLQEGILDLAVPMAYFTEPQLHSSWEAWERFARLNRFERQIAMGLGAYLNSPSATVEQINSALRSERGAPGLDGVVLFSYAVPGQAGLQRQTLSEFLTRKGGGSDSGPFRGTARIPGMPWKQRPTPGHLLGRITSAETRTGLDGAVVQLTGPVSRRLVTDANGWYGAVDLPTGEYSVRVSQPGLEVRRTSIAISKGAVAHLNVPIFRVPAVRPKPPAAQPPSPVGPSQKRANPPTATRR